MSPFLTHTELLLIIFYGICSGKFAKVIAYLVLKDTSLPFSSLNIVGDFLLLYLA